MYQAKNHQRDDMALPSPPMDSISCLRCNDIGDMLVATSWDNSVRCYQLQMNNGMLVNVVPQSQAAHDGPVLSCDIAADNYTVLSGGVDCQVKMWDVAGGSPPQQIGQHQAPVKSVRFIRDRGLVASAGWDGCLHFWDARMPQPAHTFNLDERIYAMDARGAACVAATANRTIYTFDLAAGRELQRVQSGLKFQIRCVSIFADVEGYAAGSVEGRIEVVYFDDRRGRRNDGTGNFIFKCHRDKIYKTQAARADDSTPENVFCVNDICFHPSNIFATAGSDGTFAFWDKDVRHRLGNFEMFKFQVPIYSSVFHPSGRWFFYAPSYDWSQGADMYNPQTMAPQIMAHPVRDAEIRASPKVGLRK